MGDELDPAGLEVPGITMSRETINDRNDRGVSNYMTKLTCEKGPS